jgi:hypothetical protein
MIRPESPPSPSVLPSADHRLRRLEKGGFGELRPERVRGRQPPLALFCLFDARREAIRLDDGREKRSPWAVADPNGLGLHEPYGDAFSWLQLTQFIEVLRDGTELISVLFGDNDQAPSPTSNRVSETAGEVIVVGPAVLILDYKLSTVVG